MDPCMSPGNSLPGSSKKEDSSPDHPHKKQKLDDEAKSEINSSTITATIDSLPDEMLVHIFKYLPVKDRLQAQKVCSRWYELGKSEVLWRCVKLSDISLPVFLNETLSSLPSCVLHFESRCQFWIKLPLSLPQFLVKLREQCPSLKTLILGNIKFLQKLTGKSYDDRIFLFKGPIHEVDILKKTSDKDGQLLDAFFPELQVLSLNCVIFNPLCFYPFFSGLVLPKITVLDLSHQEVCLPEIKDCLFATFVNLQELYLVGWNITHPNRLIFLKYLKKLRILDLGNCLVSNDTISVLIQNSTSLEELYMCFSNIRDIQRTNAETEFFPHLQSLCVKSSCVTEETIREFLTACPLLKFVNVSGCLCGITETSDLYQEFKEKCFIFTFNTVGFCNHFLKRKGCCK